MKLLIVAFCLSFANLALAENNTVADSASAMFTDMATDKCVDLNKHRLDMRDCCDYPKIPFFKIFATHCIDECVGTKDICCAMVCVWRNTKVTFHENHVNLSGLKQTLLNSVAHKDEWESLISKAVDQCDSEVKQPDVFDNMCKIPTHLAGIVNCAIKNLFLMCPNMHKSSRCETTRKYVEECL